MYCILIRLRGETRKREEERKMPLSFSLRIYGWSVVLNAKLFTTGIRSLCMVRIFDILKKLESNLTVSSVNLWRISEVWSNYIQTHRVFREQAEWTFVLQPELPAKKSAPFAEKNAAARHHVLRSLISLHNEHRVSDNTVHSYMLQNQR
jgi:hypothetical protein